MAADTTARHWPAGAGEGVPIKETPALIEIGKAEVTRNFAQSAGRKVALFRGKSHRVNGMVAEVGNTQ